MVISDFRALVKMAAVALTPPCFADRQKLAPLARATIFVSDIDRSLRLYRDLLGLEVMFDHHWHGARINTILGRRGIELRAVVMMAGDSAVGNLGLYQLIGPKPEDRERPVPTGGARTGDCALVFPTNDIEGLSLRIEGAGYAIVSPIMCLVERPEAVIQGAEMMFRDDDGILVNLVRAAVSAPAGLTAAPRR